MSKEGGKTFPPGTFQIVEDEYQEHLSMTWIHGKQTKAESMNFDETESVVWRAHQLRRVYLDRDNWWTSSRRTTALKWALVILTGLLIACIGAVVQICTYFLNRSKFQILHAFTAEGDFSNGFFSLLGFSLLYAGIAGLTCCIEPAAAGGGIAEVKAYLNGVNLNKAVRLSVCVSKVIGMIFSCASGLPLGKEGPMIHAGSIVGAAVSQGKTFTFGLDTSWTKFQDLRNDRSKRDFVTYGAAAGVAAAFRAPIGGIMFTLEEGASFWSTSLTFRAFFCALITQLTINLFLVKASNDRASTILGTSDAAYNFGQTAFQFGTFDDFPGYYLYELAIFVLIGAAGGVMGAFFNHISEHLIQWRMKNEDTPLKKMADLLIVTFVWTVMCFVLSLLWASTQPCTMLPVDTAQWTSQQFILADELVRFECSGNHYNQLASLFLTDPDTAMRQLFHLREYDGSTDGVFTSGALLIFFIFYFIMSAVTSGVFAPSGLFIPTLLTGAAFGRMVGHILNCAFPGYVTDSGSYALIGAAAMLGGVARMTIAGTVIVLEACGNSQYLLPLMLTFAAARYTGNAINEPIYDILINLKEMPFLADTLKTLGLLNYQPVTEIMSTPVKTIQLVSEVGTIYNLLSNTTHNGFPVVSEEGHLLGFILRKSLTCLLKLKAFSKTSQGVESGGLNTSGGPVNSAVVFHDYVEKHYPHYPDIESIKLMPAEMTCMLDVRPYMEQGPYALNESSSVQRCYRFFRTMGLRHLVILDTERKVTGIITRHDITSYRLEHHWLKDGSHLLKHLPNTGTSKRILRTKPKGGLSIMEDGNSNMLETQGVSDSGTYSTGTSYNSSGGMNPMFVESTSKSSVALEPVSRVVTKEQSKEPKSVKSFK